MPLDGISAKCLALELSTRLGDARVDRIYQPDRFDILMILRRGSENLRLILSANPSAPRLHLTSESRDNPAEPPMFCMLLRKHLLGARLTSVETPGYERIFILRFQTVNELGDQLEKRLIIEIMGRHSNIILTNHEDRIHDAILHVDQDMSRVREVMPARLYVFPPEQNKLPPQAVVDRLATGAAEAIFLPAALGRPLEKALLESLQGFSPQLCLETCSQAGLDPRLRAGQLDNTQQRHLALALTALLSAVLERRFVPSVFYVQAQDPVPVDFHSLPLTSLAHGRPTGSLSQAMDLFYLERNRQNTLRQKQQGLQKIVGNQLDHARRKLQIHEADCREGENREQYRRFGELIVSQIPAIAEDQTVLQSVDYFDPDLRTIAIPLQAGLTPAQNAQRYFRLYAKARSKFETGTRLIQEDRQEIEWLESVLSALETSGELADIRAIREELAAAGLIGADGQSTRAAYNREGAFRKNSRTDPGSAGKAAAGSRAAGRSHPADLQPGKPGKRSKRGKFAPPGQPAKGGKTKGSRQPAPLPPRRYVSSDGLTMLVGRNNLQNDQLTLKTAQKDDLWLHVQKMPGTHVIIRCGKQPVPARTLEEAAAIAAWFSRAAGSLPASGSVGQKVAVDYCPVSHVRKPPGARPGKVIYERYQTIMARPEDPRAWQAEPDPAESSL